MSNITTLDLGPVRPVWKGEYSSSATYELLNTVSYYGSSWIMTKTPYVAGSLPSLGSPYWGLMSGSGSNNKQFLFESNNRLKILAGTFFAFSNNLQWMSNSDTYIIPSQVLDTGTIRNGRDYSVYLCHNGTAFSFKVSLSEIAPAGFTVNNALRIGGFHTLCVDAGNLGHGHLLNNKKAGSILPASVWCTTHRPLVAKPNGMVYQWAIGNWVDIYLYSGTGTATASVYGARHTVSRTFSQVSEDLLSAGKMLLNDHEFRWASNGSNQQTAIQGERDHSTVGGHSDWAGRRMISDIGCEEMCGYLAQYLRDTTFSAGDDYEPSLTNMGWAITFGAIIAGGGWDAGIYCGSYARLGGWGASLPSATLGGRGRSADIVNYGNRVNTHQ